MLQIDKLIRSGEINREAIEVGFHFAKPGVKLNFIDYMIRDYLLSVGAKPLFLGYKGFPGAACLSPNNVVVHGVPNDYILMDGDILTIDMGTDYLGAKTDSAITRIIEMQNTAPKPDEFYNKSGLIDACQAILRAELSVIKNNCSLLDIALAGQEIGERYHIKIYPQFGGHSIGEELHMPPFIPNIIDPELSSLKWDIEAQKLKQIKLKTDQVVCIEPVVTYKNTDTILANDGWSVLTADGADAAHVESCGIVKEHGIEILC